MMDEQQLLSSGEWIVPTLRALGIVALTLLALSPDWSIRVRDKVKMRLRERVFLWMVRNRGISDRFRDYHFLKSLKDAIERMNRESS